MDVFNSLKMSLADQMEEVRFSALDVMSNFPVLGGTGPAATKG